MRMIMAMVAAPAISAPDMPATFSIQTGNSREYAHGGLTLQECYTPVLTVSWLPLSAVEPS
jgi:hypothetical protein